MKKVTGTQLIIGGILLYLLLKGKQSAAPAPVKPASKLPVQVYATTTRTESQKPVQALAGEWEFNCYHQVI